MIHFEMSRLILSQMLLMGEVYDIIKKLYWSQDDKRVTIRLVHFEMSQLILTQALLSEGIRYQKEVGMVTRC